MVENNGCITSMEGDLGKREIIEVKAMLKQIMQAVNDGHLSLHKKHDRILNLLEATLEGGNMNAASGVPSLELPSLSRRHSPLKNSESSLGSAMTAATSAMTAATSRKKNGYDNENLDNYSLKPVEMSIRQSSPSFQSEDPISPSFRQVSVYSEVIKDLSRGRSFMRFARPVDLIVNLRTFVRDPQFDFVMGVVILLNSLYIGFMIERSIHRGIDDEAAPVMEYIFLGIYVIELLLRIWAFGFKKAFENGWNCLDLVLVSLGSMSLLILEPIKRNTDSGQAADYLQQVTVLRLLRLLRLVRSLRLLQQFRILWGLVNGLLHALPAILSTLALLIILGFIFACLGVELITKSSSMRAAAENDSQLRSILDLYFATLPKVSLFLVRFTTMDSIGTIYEPLIRQQPSLILYFVIILLVVSITLMNLITAVLVEHSITMAKTDNDMETHLNRKKIKGMIPQIEDLFTRLDSNKDGLLTVEEVRTSDAHMPKVLSRLVATDTLVDLFEALDNDNSGSVDKEEFVEGLIDLALSEVPLETIKILHCCRVQKKHTRKMFKKLHELRGEVEACNIALRSNAFVLEQDGLALEGHVGRVGRSRVGSRVRNIRGAATTPPGSPRSEEAFFHGII